MSVCTEVLIEDAKAHFLCEFDGMVRSGLTSELSIMHSLLERTADGLQAIGKNFQQIIAEEGQAIVDAKCREIVTEAKSSDEVRRCLPLIKDLIDLHTEYSPPSTHSLR